MIEELHSMKKDSNRGGFEVDIKIDKLGRTFMNECSMNG